MDTYIRFLKLICSVGVANLLLVACSGMVSADVIDDAEPTRKIKVFLLAGQSNMDGRGDGSRLSVEDEARLEAVGDRVQLAYNGEPARPLGVTTPKPHTAKRFGLEQVFGPELFFGLAVAEAFPDSRILLIKRSVGGTSLYGRWNPDWSLEKARLVNEQDTPPLYQELLNSISDVLQDYDVNDYEFEGMLWVQGETDSALQKFGPLPAAAYGDNLKTLINAIRRDTSVADLPFYMLQVGSGKVVDGMRTAVTSMDNVHFIPQSGDPDAPNYLPKYDPPIGHYDYTGMKRIGNLFAETYLSSIAVSQKLTRPNVLFIAVDDLKPLTGSYGDSLARTPSIDALAANSTVFTKAYVQYPVCGPSRSSLLTGLRPETNGVLDLKTRLRDVHPDIITLPQLFKMSGYETAAVGKIFDPRNVDSRQDDDPASWSIPYKLVSGKVDGKMEPNYATAAIDARDSEFIDGQINKLGIELLQSMASSGKPFFLGVGFKKPHLPFVAPKRFFDLYDRESFDLATFQTAPEGSDASYILNNNGELRTYWPRPAAGSKPAPYAVEISQSQQRELLHGYYAAVSFVDSLVGDLLKALADSDAADNTIVVLWGDHGFHLGDHGMWGKHTTMEQAARHPLMILVPGMDPARSDSLVEAMDIYPTLAELADLQGPGNLQGRSLVPILRDSSASVRDVAITQYKRQGAYGYSMRTDRYRYTEWVRPNGVTVYRDLYDMSIDPGERENIAAYPENAELVESFASLLRRNRTGLLRLDEYEGSRK